MSDLRQDLISELTRETCRRGDGFADPLDMDHEGSIRGRAVPIGQWVTLGAGQIRERYEPGVFDKQTDDPSRVKICLEHGQVVGTVQHLEERQDGVYFTGTISNDPRIPEAGKARAMIAGGLMDEVSIGFRALPGGTATRHLSDGTMTWTHHKAQLLHIGLVPWGAMGRDATLARALFDTDFDPDMIRTRAAVAARVAEERAWLNTL